MPPPRPPALYLALAVGPGLFLLGVLARQWPAAAQPTCVAHALTGLPCPGCGSYRALCLFTAGRWMEAWRLQPLMTVFFALMLLLSAAAWLGWLFRIPVPEPRPLTRREQLLLAVGLALAVLTNWFYLLAVRPGA